TAARHDSLDRRGNRTGPGDRALPALRITARRALSGQDRRGRELTRPYTRSTYPRRGSVMAIGLRLKVSGGTQQNYAAHGIMDMESDPPKGMIFHSAGPIDGGWGVIDFWE